VTAEQSRAVFKAAGIISVVTVLSRLLGYLRDALLAARFGATHITDAYVVAQDLPASLYAAVGVTLVTVFIPVYRESLQKRGEEASWRLVNTVLNMTLLVSGVLLVLGLVLAPLYVPLLVPGLPEEPKALAVSLTRTMLPMLLFMGMAGVASAVLNANRHFTAPAMVGLVNNLPVVLMLMVVSATWQIRWVAWSVVFGAVAGALMLMPLLPRLGFRYQPVVDWHDPGLAQVGRLIVPVLITTVLVQFQDFLDRFLASHLAEGSISALNYAVKVNSLPYGVVGAAISTVLYPSLAEHAADAEIPALRRTVTAGMRTMAFVLLPMALGLWVFREEIVKIIFERGAFDLRATAATAYALQFYSLGILFFGWQDFLQRCFFSLQDTLTPLLSSLLLVGLSVTFKILLVGPLYHGGLALGSVLAAVAAVLFLLARLRRRLGGIGGREILRATGLNLATSVAGCAAGYVLYQGAAQFFPTSSLLDQAVRLGVGLSTVVAVHVGLALLAGLREASDLVTQVAGRLRKR